MKFLHAADIHLDSPLAGLQTRADLPGDVVRHCTRRAFEAMVKLAVDEDVAFVNAGVKMHRRAGVKMHRG